MCQTSDRSRRVAWLACDRPSSRHNLCCCAQASDFQAGPSEPAPSYAALDEKLLNKAIMALFRRRMVAAIGEDSSEQG